MKRTRSAGERSSLAASNREAYFRSRQHPGPLPDPKIGETVAYSRYFLLQISEAPTSLLWGQRGIITKLMAQGFVRVRWDGDNEVTVNLSCLSRPGPNLRFCD